MFEAKPRDKSYSEEPDTHTFILAPEPSADKHTRRRHSNELELAQSHRYLTASDQGPLSRIDQSCGSYESWDGWPGAGLGRVADYTLQETALPRLCCKSTMVGLTIVVEG